LRFYKEKLAVYFLSIYAAFREIPLELSSKEKENLKNNVNSGVIRAFEKEPDRITAIVEKQFPFPWLSLLTEPTLKAIQSR
jgi:hypothetical protein